MLEKEREELRDDVNYYASKRPSNSSIGRLIDDPKTFTDPFPRHINLTMGSYFHDLCTRPEVAEDRSIFPISEATHRREKEYKELQALHTSDIVMKRSEAEQMEALADLMKSQSFFQTIMSSKGVLIEEPYLFEAYGVIWKMKVDLVVPEFGLAIDLKTSSTQTDLEFEQSCYKWGYTSQASMYLKPFPPDWKFLFYVGHKDPMKVKMYEPGKDMLAHGEERIKNASEVYKKWEPYFNRVMM